MRQQGADWSCLGDMAEAVIDGWRVSRNKLAGGFDAAVVDTSLYHLRNVQPYILQTERKHWLIPNFTEKAFCVQPLDIVIKKVGGACAALVSDAHGHHPVDGNLALVRGLSSQQAVWVCFCLNQPLYKDYLEESDAIGALVRLGLKKIKSTPVCPMPEEFEPLAQAFLGAYGRLADAQGLLASIRKQVEAWLTMKLEGFDSGYWQNAGQRHWQFFSPIHIDDSLLISQVEQNYLRSELLQKFHFQPISTLAVLNPSPESSRPGEADKVLQIGNISDSLAINSPLPDRADSRWRIQQRRLQQYDVVMSTFAENARVAYLHRRPEEKVCPGEQVAVLKFYNYPAAYALLMETWLVRMQLRRLASGGGLRFVGRRQLSKLVLPDLEPETGAFWQQKMAEHHDRSQHALNQLAEVTEKMVPIFDKAHKNTSKTRVAA